jgi:RimJ/RimL family protein N-acetyltransferase
MNVPAGLVVRAAGPEDAEGIAVVHTVAWQHAYAGLLPQEYLDRLDWRRRCDRWLSQLSSDDAGAVLVALDGDAVVGFVSFGTARDPELAEAGWQEVYAIYLVPERWGGGLGRRLWEAARATMPRPLPGVSVWVLAGNDRARRAYEAWDFRLDGARKAAEIGGAAVTEVRMGWWGGGRRSTR